MHSDGTAREIAHNKVEEFNELDTRVSAIDCLYANIIGVNENTIEWCPNEEPPLVEEYIAWLWVINPKMEKQLLAECPEELLKLINAYNSKNMEKWFEYIAT